MQDLKNQLLHQLPVGGRYIVNSLCFQVVFCASDITETSLLPCSSVLPAGNRQERRD